MLELEPGILSRDPIGYRAGNNQYELVNGRSLVGGDPSGLECVLELVSTNVGFHRDRNTPSNTGFYEGDEAPLNTGSWGIVVDQWSGNSNWYAAAADDSLTLAVKNSNILVSERFNRYRYFTEAFAVSRCTVNCLKVGDECIASVACDNSPERGGVELTKGSGTSFAGVRFSHRSPGSVVQSVITGEAFWTYNASLLLGYDFRSVELPINLASSITEGKITPVRRTEGECKCKK